MQQNKFYINVTYSDLNVTYDNVTYDGGCVPWVTLSIYLFISDGNEMLALLITRQRTERDVTY